jgi:tRNA A-37 threonylcarbamoyl transferase component Bud32
MNIRDRFTSMFRTGSTRAAMQMTWASRSLTHSVTRAGLFLRKQLWVWPILAVILLSLIGIVARGAIESTIKGNLAAGLQTLVALQASMLENYFEVHQASATALARDAQIRQYAYQLLGASTLPTGRERRDPDEARPSASEAARYLERELAPSMSSHDYEGYFLAGKDETIVAASAPSLVGQSEIEALRGFLQRVLDGETVVSPPFPSVTLMRPDVGKGRTVQPTMYVAAPIRDESFQVIGALALQIRPDIEFTRILKLGRVGNTGETYAFNAEGLMVSESRFEEELILLGLMPDKPETSSILEVMIRDPGGDMTRGFRPPARRSKLPLTRMAESALAGQDGVDVEGYRDYRGVEVVGAWQWLPTYRLGIATEVDAAQAFRPLILLQRVFWLLLTLLILSSIAIFVFTVLVARARRDAQRAAIKAQRLGQYSLDEKLGAGSIGVVYKGHHAMMRRPTAIKMLHIDKVDEAAITRFEREVQLTCQLTHPNTIAIYDYGRTPEGVFYYAMEYIEGINLQSLVTRYGAQPPSRVIHILTQMCGSLYEAHTVGLVHRDIKPANTMLCRRGGEPDVVKVLDFGLVKAVDEAPENSRRGGLTGTPLYMSPESIQSPLTVDGRSDLYAVGAVGYYLLTGKTVFEAANIAELCQKQIDASPVSPSQRTAQAISQQLEFALMKCLEKSRAKRPQTARDLASLLSKCPEANAWTSEDGDAWWSRHLRENGPEPRAGDAAATGASSGLDQTIDH